VQPAERTPFRRLFPHNIADRQTDTHTHNAVTPYPQSFILQCLRPVHSLFQSQFSTQCDLVLPLAISSILFFPLKVNSSCLCLLLRLPITSVFPLYLSLNSLFQKAVPTQDVTNPVSLTSFYCLYDVPLPLTLCNTSSFLTRSVQLIFAAPSQHHISKLPQ